MDLASEPVASVEGCWMATGVETLAFSPEAELDIYVWTGSAFDLIQLDAVGKYVAEKCDQGRSITRPGWQSSSSLGSSPLYYLRTFNNMSAVYSLLGIW